MARNEFVKARVSQEEKEIYQQLCEQAGCTEAELIRSVLIHREISLDDLDDEMQVLDRKKKALHKQQEDYRRAQASRETDERGEPISEKRCIPFQVMLTAPEKKGNWATCGGSWHFCKRTGSTQRNLRKDRIIQF